MYGDVSMVLSATGANEGIDSAPPVVVVQTLTAVSLTTSVVK